MNTETPTLLTLSESGYIPYVNLGLFKEHCCAEFRYASEMGSLLFSPLLFDRNVGGDCVRQTLLPGLDLYMMCYSDPLGADSLLAHRHYRSNHFPIKTVGGIRLVSPRVLFDAAARLKPRYVQLPGLSLPPESGVKLEEKFANRTLEFAKEYLSLCKDAGEEECALPLATVVGRSIDQRLRCASQLAGVGVAGYVICDIGSLSPDQLLEITLTLPHGKPKVTLDSLDYGQVSWAFRSGVTTFASVYPTLMTRKRVVLLAHTDDPHAVPSEYETRIEEYRRSHSSLSLVTRCECYTCLNFTGAYVHHLLDVGEMLGDMLLFTHNYCCYKNFIASLAKSGGAKRTS